MTKTCKHRGCFAAALIAASLLGCPSGAFAQQQSEWSWKLPVDLYGKLDIPQRSNYERSSNLHEMGEKYRKDGKETDAVASFRAASAEWKRFTLEFMDAPEFALAYAHFMQGYDMLLAKDRNAAVKIFTEVMDFYPETPSAIVPALFWRAEAHMQNGDRDKAVADWDMIAETDGAAGHPLVLETLDRLGQDAWTTMRWDEAGARWLAILRDHPTGAQSLRDAAARNLMNLRGAQGRWGDLDAALRLVRADANGRTEYMGSYIWSTWYYRLHPDSFRKDYFQRAFPKENDTQINERIDKFKKGLVEWFSKQGAVYAEADKAWDHSLAVFHYSRMIYPDKASELAVNLAGQIRSSKLDAAEKERRARGLIENLASANMPVEARTLLDLIEKPLDRLRLAYTVEERTAQYAEAEKVLDQMDQQPDAQFVRSAKRLRAYLYKDRMGKFEQAIPLFTEGVDPPQSLWGIQECYWRLGRKDNAQQTLTEIASIFPDDAARAMFQKAEYFRLDKDNKSAIAHYRRILSHPDWKKSGEASRSHQLLETLGVETGGAVIHDVN